MLLLSRPLYISGETNSKLGETLYMEFYVKCDYLGSFSLLFDK